MKKRQLSAARKTVLAATAAAVTLSLAATFGTVAETGKKMNDLEIAHAAYTAGQIDIRYAHLAMALSTNPEVKKFAQTMLRDHVAVNNGAVALLTKLKVSPQPNNLSAQLLAGAEKNINKFRKLTGKAFDCAYAKNELGYHQVVNKTVAEVFIPNVTVPDLRSLLADALITFKVHEGHAKHMVSGLQCVS